MNVTLRPLYGYYQLQVQVVVVVGCKHGKVDSYWSLPSVEWKWYILCINFEFCEEKNIEISKKILIYIAKQFMMTKKIQRTSTYSKDGASGVQGGDI